MTDIIPYALPDIRELLAGRLSASTIKVYREDIAQYMAFCQGQDLQQFDSQSLCLWRDDMVLHSTKSPNTINRQLAAVRRTVKEAASRRMIDGAVAYAFTQVESVSVRALRSRLKQHGKTRILPAQMRMLCDSPSIGTDVGLRDRALLHTLATSGVRISELVSLTVGQIEQAGDFFIVHVTGKTDIESRDAPLSIEAKQHIDAWLAARPVASDYVFTQFDGRGKGEHSRLDSDPLSRQAAWVIIHHYAQHCGLEHVKPHDFRRFLATELSGRDVIAAQRALGHKNLNTTQRYVLSGLKPGLTDNLF